MDNAIDFVLRKMLLSAKELFVEEDEFLEFRQDVDSGIRSGTNSTSASGQILYSRRGKICTSPHLFVKLNADVPAFDTLNLQQHINEVHFYSKIQPCFQKLRATDSWLPKFYASHLDVSEYGCTEVLVLEDLRPSGFSACRVKDSKPLDRAHLSLMMRKVGEFHAYSYKARVVDCDRFCGLVHSLQNVSLSFTQLMRPRTVRRLKMACEPLREDGRYADALAKFDDVLENFYDFVAASMAAEGNGGSSSASVLCHLSFSRSNALFRYDAEGEKPVDAVIVDWQTCLPSNVGVDILTALYVDTDQETRDEHWDDLVDEYYRALSQTFPDITVPSKDEVIENLKMKVGATLQVASNRIPHKNFAAYKKIRFTSTPESVENNYVDPLTSILKDMIDRKLFC